MELDFEKMNGLIPAIIQDNYTQKVLMLGFMNKEAYEKTIADAVLDRIVHHSLRVELFGESIRKRKSKSENAYG